MSEALKWVRDSRDRYAEMTKEQREEKERRAMAWYAEFMSKSGRSFKRKRTGAK